MALRLGDLIAIGGHSARRYPLRTAQTVAGVVAGVAAVVAAAAINESAQAKAVADLDHLGPNTIIIRVAAGSASDRPLSRRDADALGRSIPGLATPVPTVNRLAAIAGTSMTRKVRLVGAAPGFGTLIHVRLAEGRLSGAADERSRARVCVLGAALARALFGYRRVVGERVRIDGEWFSVIGVLQERGASANRLRTAASDLDRAALVPVSVVIQPTDAIEEIWIDAADSARVSVVARILERSVGQLVGAHDAVEVIVPRELLRQRVNLAHVFSAAGVAAGALLLVVGGLGVSNAMFASVTMRRSEIGLRRSVGATRRDIAAQFLVETLAITVAGGLAGCLLGLILSGIAAAVAGWPVALPLSAPPLAVVISVVTALLAGVQPARHAAAVEPIDAIMAE